MKKLSVLIATIVLSCVFFACSSSLDGVGVAAFTPVTVAAATTEKGGSYSDDVVIDVALADNAYAEGADVTDLFTQSTVNATSSARSARAAEVTATSEGLRELKATIKEITASSFTVTITATASNTDCTVVVTAIIPAERTKSGKPVVKNVKKVTVGAGAGEISSGAMSLAGATIPSKSELAGKTLVDKNDERVKKYTFDATGLKVTRVKEYAAGVTGSSKEYDYDPETGLLQEADYDDDFPVPFDKEYIVKVNGTYYLYMKDAPFTRVSGSGLSGEFKYAYAESQTYSANGLSITAKAELSAALVFNGDGTFTGNEAITVSIAGETYEDDECLLSGGYTNTDGLISVKGKSTVVGSWVDPINGETKYETHTGDFGNGYAFYTGDTVYLVSYKFTTE